jgi:LacI family xylobiose transport system transcriptional regulator
VFATSDVKAFGVYEAARSLGLGVPADLSVVGYDDLQFARFAGPALTTVHQPLAEMAQEATRLLLAIRRGEDRSADRIELTTSLIVRQSTAPQQGRIG